MKELNIVREEQHFSSEGGSLTVNRGWILTPSGEEDLHLQTEHARRDEEVPMHGSEFSLLLVQHRATLSNSPWQLYW